MKLDNWKLCFAPNCKCRDLELKTIEEIEKTGFDIIKASVPGNFEIDLMNSDKLCDLYYDTNTLEAQKYENMHLWYYTEFESDGSEKEITFEGIDTIADIYINGEFSGRSENMFLPFKINAKVRKGKNAIVVHILPVMLEARKKKLNESFFANPYNYASLGIRKAPYMYGWDIMPRIVSAGLWKAVTVSDVKAEKINEVRFMTTGIDKETKIANMNFFINADISGDFITDYSIRINGKCEESEFSVEKTLWHNSFRFDFDIENVKLWYPKNYGEAKLYNTSVELLYKGDVIDVKTLNIGIRTIELHRTDMTDNEGNGDFSFIVNGQRVFCLGTNWVPLDAFPSKHEERLDRGLELLNDIGCNIVRLWGGNVYENDRFYEFCDEHGIMVWQDFAMACGVYPEEEEFKDNLENEAIYHVKRLRNHPALILWSGDNECDIIRWVCTGINRNPNENSLTREVLKNVVEQNSNSIPYLASSPYVSNLVFEGKGILPEHHLWGPRDYFKGDFYKKKFCHFASEIGYHGFPSVESLKKFIKEPEKIFEEDGSVNPSYVVHAASPECSKDSPYYYRIKLAYDQVVTLFGKAENDLEDFVIQSQISQAEAKKYFIEKFRIEHKRRSGIIWWNLLDGWPQVSDAVVDYYYDKKLAYDYIKRSQRPICLMFDEPQNGAIELSGVNDLQADMTVIYKVINVKTDEVVLSGEQIIPANMVVMIEKYKINNNDKNFYIIEWEDDFGKGYNHYQTNLLNIDYKEYVYNLKKSGFIK